MKKPLLTLLLTAATLAAAPSPPTRAPTSSSAAPSSRAPSVPAHVARPADGWFHEQGVTARQDCAQGRSGRGLYTTTSTSSSLFRLNAPAHTTITRLYLTYRAHLSGAEAWAVPTFVVQAGHAGAWESVGPARSHIGADPIDFGGTGVVAEAHDADALRIGMRCDLLRPVLQGRPARPRASTRSPSCCATTARRATTITAPGGHVRGTIELPLTATDEGGGVYERIVRVDGRPLIAHRALPDGASVGRDRAPCRCDGCPARSTRPPASGSTRARSPTGGTRCSRGWRTSGATSGPTRPRSSSTTGRRAAARSRSWGRPRPPRRSPRCRAGSTGRTSPTSYRWQRCDAQGEGCTEIGGAVERTYALRSGDVGHRVRAVVTASDGGGSVQVASAASEIVTGPGTGPAGGFSAATARRAPAA